jgi:hypothetical protein
MNSSLSQCTWVAACLGLGIGLTQLATAQSTSIGPIDQTVVYVLAVDPTASEAGPDTATFRVVRSGRTDLPLTVFYRLSGTASNGLDYLELPTTVVIPAGASSVDVTVQPIDDTLVEGPESVVLILVDPICILIWPPPPDCYLVGRAGAARAVIYDNDTAPNQPPVVQLHTPQDGDVFRAPAEIALRAYAEDPEDGYNLKVEFFEGDRSLGLGEFVPALCPAPFCPFFALTWSNVPPGEYVLTAVATDSAGQQTISAPVRIKVVGVEPLPVVNIRTIQAEGAEPVPLLPAFYPIIFEVSRTGPTNAPLPVFYRLGGTASNGMDYMPLPGVITIPTGAATALLEVLPTDDTLCEGDESVVVRLVLPPCSSNAASPQYVLGPDAQARGIIHDNDVCPTNQPPRVVLVEPQDGDVFVPPADIRVCARANDPDGFIRQVDFFEGNRLIGSVTGSSNDVELFCIRWPGVPPGSYVLTAVATDNAGASSRSAPVRIRVLPPPQPVVVIEAIDPVATEPDPNSDRPFDTATFTVRRDRGTNLPLTVYYSLSGTASNGVDYRRLSGQVTIPVGAFTARIVVDPIDDELVEGTETVIARLEPPICIAIWPPPPDCYLIGHPSVATAYIHDNDLPTNLPPRVVITSPAQGQVFDAPGPVPILAVALDPDGWVPLVEFFEGTNKIGQAEMLFIIPPPPGQTQHFSLVWSNVPPGRYLLTARATDNLGASSLSPPVAITVREPPTAPVVTITAPDAYGREGTVPDPCVFRVRRTGPTNSSLTVRFAISGTASNGVDYVRLPESVTIPAGRRSAQIVVTPIDDRRAEPIETVILRLLPSTSYQLGRPEAAGAIIVDNDWPVPATVALPDRCFHLRAAAPNGLSLRIECSTNLRDWEPLCVSTATNGAVHFVDPDAATRPMRFYRLVPDLVLADEE